MTDDGLAWVKEAADTHRQRELERAPRRKARRDIRVAAGEFWSQLEEQIRRVVERFNREVGKTVLLLEEAPGSSVEIKSQDRESVSCRVALVVPKAPDAPYLDRLARWSDDYGESKDDRLALELVYDDAKRQVLVRDVGNEPSAIVKALLQPWLDQL